MWALPAQLSPPSPHKTPLLYTDIHTVTELWDPPYFIGWTGSRRGGDTLRYFAAFLPDFVERGCGSGAADDLFVEFPETSVEMAIFQAESSTVTQVTNDSLRADKGKQMVTQKENIICPKPRRVNPNQLPFDGFSQVFPESNSLDIGDYQSEILDLILTKEENETDPGFYTGSPPIRTNNPLIHDAIFEQAQQIIASSLSSCSSSNSSASVNSSKIIGIKKPRIETSGSPTTCAVTSGMSSTPKIRVEGFALFVSTI
ncbi:hypothetical protein LUZ60_007869 [Juncus effusus]|nr:hypothetical protein LUZ60_007869 [Juncus effusus]